MPCYMFHCGHNTISVSQDLIRPILSPTLRTGLGPRKTKHIQDVPPAFLAAYIILFKLIEI